MATLCFVTTCMGRLSALRETLGSMTSQPGCSCVVVDYACPDRAGDWVEAHHPETRVVRVPGRLEFNLSAARNAGARQADSPWVCFVDADVRLEPGFAAALLAALAPGDYFRAPPSDGGVGGVGGTFACARADFERAGGYDEVYRGWGEEDNDLYDSLQFLGLRQRTLPVSMLHHIPHGDEARTRFYSVADFQTGHAVNRVYRILKWDAARLGRELLPPDFRRAIYDKVAEVVTEAVRTGQTGDLALHLPPGIVPGGRSLSRTLSYRLTRDGG